MDKFQFKSCQFYQALDAAGANEFRNVDSTIIVES